MLFSDLLGALGVRTCKALLQDAEISVMSISRNKEHTGTHTQGKVKLFSLLHNRKS